MFCCVFNVTDFLAKRRANRWKSLQVSWCAVAFVVTRKKLRDREGGDRRRSPATSQQDPSNSGTSLTLPAAALAPGCSASDRPCRPCSSPNPSRPWLAACAPTVAVRRSRAAMEVPLRSLCFNPGRAKALQWPRASADLDAATSGLSLRLASLPLPLLLLLTQTSPDRHPPPQHGRQSRASQPEPRDADQGRARGHAHDRQHVASEAPSIR